MRICLLTQTLNPKTGTGVFAGNIIDGVRRARPDIEFSIITCEDYIKTSIYHILKNWPHIRSEVKKANIVHAIDGYPYGIIACLANIGISRPIIITAIGSGSIRKLGNFGWKSLLLRWAYGRATRIVTISHYVSREIKKILPHLSIEVINPGVDYDFYDRTEDSRDASILTGEYVITQGEFKRRKGYTEMLPIMKKIMNAHPEIRYVMVANVSRNQPYQNELYELMEKLGIRDKVVILSDLTREKLREAYRNAVLYLTLPINIDGDVEGFGMAIMEASATGTSAIVGRGSGADDAVSDGRSGFLVDGKDEAGILEKILSLIDNKELREKLSNGAKRWARENNLESKAKQYISLYEKV